MSSNLHLSDDWKAVFSDRHFIIQSVITLFVVGFLIVFTMNFFEYIQARPGKYLNDPLLKRIPSRDLSIYTFVLLYSSIVFAVAQLANRPRLLLQGVQIYCLIISLRIVTLYLVPLEPSQNMIPLRDPFIEYLIYKEHMISKDLFFSGHVSTVFLAVLMVRGKWQKLLLLVATLAIAVLILIQHVHYTIDVIAAPAFTFGSYFLVKKGYRKYAEWFV